MRSHLKSLVKNSIATCFPPYRDAMKHISALSGERDRLKKQLMCYDGEFPAGPWNSVGYLFHAPQKYCVQEVAETTIPYPTDISFIQRLVRFYDVCHEKIQLSQDSMWNYISTFKVDVHNTLIEDYKNGNIENSAKILSDPINSELWFGFSGPTKSRYKPLRVTRCTNWDYDVLYRLVQSFGCVTMPNSESNSPAPHDYPSAELLFEKLDGLCGIRIPISNVYPHIIGLKTERGVIDYRALSGLYCAKRLKDMGASRVLEIGGGLGWVAYYSYILGIKDYTIIDIPLSCVASAHMLGAALGPDHVALYGEPLGEYQVKILPPEAFPNEQKFDVILNIDSMTEMSQDVALGYLKFISQCAKYFISINHETNPFTVSQLLDGFSNIKSKIRYPHWLRKGYAEEIYEFV